MFSVEIWTQTLISGLMMGFVFSLIAIGLTLIFGVMDIVNFAHGEFMMLAMYVAYWLYTLLGVDPLLSLPINIVSFFFLGIITYRLLIRQILRAPMLVQIFATFGLMVFLQNIAQFLWKPDFRTIGQNLLTGRFSFFGIYLGITQVVTALGALLTTLAVFYIVKRTGFGIALRATAQDREAASLMGIDTDQMYGYAWGIGTACVAIAGTLLATFYTIFPQVGITFSLTTFVIVALGGFGSIFGAFVAGLIVGIVEVMGGFLVAPAYKTILVLLLYLLVVFIRPQGLFGSR